MLYTEEEKEIRTFLNVISVPIPPLMGPPAGVEALDKQLSLLMPWAGSKMYEHTSAPLVEKPGKEISFRGGTSVFYEYFYFTKKK